MARIATLLSRGLKSSLNKVGRRGRDVLTKVGRIGLQAAKKHGATIGSIVGSFTPVGSVGGELIGSAVQKLANTFG